MHLPQTAGLAINSLLFVIEFGAGILSGSSTLLADSLDMLGDALVYGVSLFVVGRSLVWCARAALLKGLVMAFLAALFLAACNPSARDSTAYHSVETITAGCGGGIAGIIEFVTVHRDGRVDYRLMGPRGAGPDSVSETRVDKWLESLEAARFFQHSSRQGEVYPDQLGCTIELVGPHRTHRLEVSQEPSLDPNIRRVFDEVYGLIPRK